MSPELTYQHKLGDSYFAVSAASACSRKAYEASVEETVADSSVTFLSSWPLSSSLSVSFWRSTPISEKIEIFAILSAVKQETHIYFT